MRPIKFRAWDKQEKQMMYDDNTATHDIQSLDGIKTSGVGYLNFILSDEYTHPEGKFIWMQYTGLNDKDGREIYEGDIVKFRANYSTAPCGDMIGKVILTEYKLELHSENGYVYNAEEETDEFPYAHCEVIGNIHENEDLL